MFKSMALNDLFRWCGIGLRWVELILSKEVIMARGEEIWLDLFLIQSILWRKIYARKLKTL